MDDRILPKWVLWVSMGQICKFWNPFRKYETGVARNNKFDTLIELGMSDLRNDKVPQRGRGGVHGPNFKILGPSLNLEFIKLNTSNLVYTTDRT